MPKLPVVKPRDIIRFLKKIGFVEVRSDGSHFRFHHIDGRKVTVPFHIRPLKKGTLRSILKQANVTTEELVEFL